MRKNKNLKSFTLIEVLVGTFLMLVVFSGIFGAYQLGLKVVGYSRDKISATAIANQELEMIRNLSYQNIGIVGGELPVPVGNLQSLSVNTINNIEYTIERRIEYVSDASDGVGASDDCDLDYKRVEIKISWAGRFAGEVVLNTDVSPKNKVQELSSCETQPGGVLSVSVFDSFGAMVISPLIEIFDPSEGRFISSYSPDNGEKDILLAVGNYKIVVSKPGYNSARSYGTEEMVNSINACHARPHQEVLEGELTPTSFCIDKVSSFSVNTLSLWGAENFSDYFVDETKISEKSDVTVAEGEVSLAKIAEVYAGSGYLFSAVIAPVGLNRWDKFIFSDMEPLNTDLKYQFFYNSGEEWELVPDSDLMGNSAGFDSSPIILADLDSIIYSQLKIKGIFSSQDINFTPFIYDWQVSWITLEPTVIPFAQFNLTGEKIIGTDSQEDPIYKYSLDANSGAAGQKNITDLEKDLYVFSTEGTGLDLVGIDPFPQPVDLPPDSSQNVILYLASVNSLLVTVQNSATAEPIFGASVRLFNAGLGYGQTQFTNDKGQTYFMPLLEGTYNLNMTADYYSAYFGSVWVSGSATEIISVEETD